MNRRSQAARRRPKNAGAQPRPEEHVEQPPRSDAELLRAVAARDERALAEVFDRYQGAVLGLAMLRLRDRDAAMTVLGDVMFAVWRGADSFEGRSQARTWVLGIAVNKIRDQLRRRPPQVCAEDEPGSAPPQAVDPAEPRMASERRTLQGCLGKLPSAQREALHLSFYLELASSDIAGLLEVPEGTVRSRLHYAVRALRRCLEQGGVRS